MLIRDEKERWKTVCSGATRTPRGRPLHMLYRRRWSRKCRTKAGIYNLLCLGADFIWWTRTVDTRVWSAVYFWCQRSSDVIDGGAVGAGGMRKGATSCMYYIFILSVCVCNGEIIVPLCVHVCAQRCSYSCACLCVSVRLHLCLRLRAHVSLSLAEHEHPSDRRAQPQCIKAQTTTAPFCERCRG